MKLRILSHDEARATYDRIGSLQDSQAFYEDRPLERLIEQADFGDASRVFEFGCGTGRVAHRLLTDHLPADAGYDAIDLSPKMVALAKERLAPFGDRVTVTLSEGAAPAHTETGAYDRFVSTFVLDLLSEEAIGEVVREAHRMLAEGGLVCLCGLATGKTLPSRVLAGAWTMVHKVSPRLVGGCRPVDLGLWFASGNWDVRHHEQLTPFGVPSEVLVAARV